MRINNQFGGSAGVQIPHPPLPPIPTEININVNDPVYSPEFTGVYTVMPDSQVYSATINHNLVYAFFVFHPTLNTIRFIRAVDGTSQEILRNNVVVTDTAMNVVMDDNDNDNDMDVGGRRRRGRKSRKGRKTRKGRKSRRSRR